MRIAAVARPASLALALVLAGCTAPPASTPTATTTIRIAGGSWTVLPGGDEGMRDRADFGGADGMLFDHGTEQEPSAIGWVMDRVRFPLDIAWFDGEGILVGIATMPACPADPCPLHHAPAPYRYAVEAPVGAFADLPADARLEVSP